MEPSKQEITSTASKPRSMLLRFPPETRLQILEEVLSTTELVFAWNWASRQQEQTTQHPVHNDLAIFRVCRQITNGIGQQWLGSVLLRFKDLPTMMDKLSALAPDELSRIRHVRIPGTRLEFLLEDGLRQVFLDIAFTPKLLPALRLDTLTVLADHNPAVAYDMLNHLIAHGSGWRELRYITQDSAMLAFGATTLPGNFDCVREPQPKYWNGIILQRDGLTSGASVTIYRSTKPAAGSVMFPEVREAFNQTPTDPEEITNFGLHGDPAIMLDCDARCKGLLVIVKRGAGADLAPQNEPPYHKQDIRHSVGDITWAEIRLHHINTDDESGYETDDDDFHERCLHELRADMAKGDEEMYPKHRYNGEDWAEESDPEDSDFEESGFDGPGSDGFDPDGSGADPDGSDPDESGSDESGSDESESDESDSDEFGSDGSDSDDDNNVQTLTDGYDGGDNNVQASPDGHGTGDSNVQPFLNRSNNGVWVVRPLPGHENAGVWDVQPLRNDYNGGELHDQPLPNGHVQPLPDFYDAGDWNGQPIYDAYNAGDGNVQPLSNTYDNVDRSLQPLPNNFRPFPENHDSDGLNAVGWDPMDWSYKDWPYTEWSYTDWPYTDRLYVDCPCVRWDPMDWPYVDWWSGC